MRFSIITPSFRSSAWLKLCIASVADQGVAVEHIVQDAGSDDGTLDWLPHDPRVRAFVEPDRGMYDAINRGLRRAGGEVLAYLNCDEQYLPGALPAVLEFFDRHPEIEVLFGDVVVVDEQGDYLFHRKVQVPRLYHTWVDHLVTFSCATFFRRRLIANEELFFDLRWRSSGDGEWMVRLLQRRIPMATRGVFTSAFTLTDANIGSGADALREAQALHRTAPAWARAVRPLFVVHSRLRRMLCGVYFQKPFSYQIYSTRSQHQRETHMANRPTPRGDVVNPTARRCTGAHADGPPSDPRTTSKSSRGECWPSATDKSSRRNWR